MRYRNLATFITAAVLAGCSQSGPESSLTPSDVSADMEHLQERHLRPGTMQKLAKMKVDTVAFDQLLASMPAGVRDMVVRAIESGKPFGFSAIKGSPEEALLAKAFKDVDRAVRARR